MHQNQSQSMLEDRFGLVPSFVYLPAQPQNLEADKSNDYFVHEVVTNHAEKPDFIPWRPPDTPSVASDIDSDRCDWDSINNSCYNFSIKTEMDENSTVITTSRSVQKKVSNVLFEIAMEQINDDGHHHQQHGNKVRSKKNRLQDIKEHIQEIQTMLPSLVWEEKDDLEGNRCLSANNRNTESQDQNSSNTKEEEDKDKDKGSNSNSNSKLVLEEKFDLDGNRGPSTTSKNIGNEDQNSSSTMEDKDEINNGNSNSKLVLKEKCDLDGNRGPSTTNKNRGNKDRKSSNTKKKKKKKKGKKNSGNSNSYSFSNSNNYSFSTSNSYSYRSSSSNSSSSSSSNSYGNRVRLRNVVQRARDRCTRLESIHKEIDRSIDPTDHYYSSEVVGLKDLPNRSYVQHDRTLIPSSPLLFTGARRPSWHSLPPPPFCQTDSLNQLQRQDQVRRRSYRRVNRRSNRQKNLTSYTKTYAPSNPHRLPMFSTELPSEPVTALRPMPRPTKIPYDLGILMASAFDSASPEMKKMIIGERLYHQIQEVEPDLAGWITGILLESDDCYNLLSLLESPKDILRDRIDDILRVLEAHEAYGV